MNTTVVIARLTFLEAARRRILLAGLLLGIAFLVLFNTGFYFIQADMLRALAREPLPAAAARNMYNFMLMAGLYAINFLSIATGALLAADTLAGEINSGTIQAVVTKPVRRAEVVAGKWLGFAGLIGLYLLMMIGGLMISVWVQSGYLAPNILRGVSLIYLTSLLMMTVTMACSSTLSTLATGGVVFGLFGLAFIGGWVERIGAFLKNGTAMEVGIVSSLIIPSEAMWQRAAFEMTSPLVQTLGISPFASPSVASPLMVVYALVYLAAMLAFTLRQFGQRDL